MCLHRSHHSHHSNSIQANRKRRQNAVVDPAIQFTYKRPRSTHPQLSNLSSLPTEEQYRQAAGILRVPIPYLRSVISDVDEEEQPAQLLPCNDWPFTHHQLRTKRAMGQVRGTPAPLSTVSMGEKAVGGEINSYTGEEQGEKSALQWNGQMNVASDFPEPASQSGRDSTFCFPKGALVDFFSNLCSVDDEPSQGNIYGKLIGEIGRW